MRREPIQVASQSDGARGPRKGVQTDRNEQDRGDNCRSCRDEWAEAGCFRPPRGAGSDRRHVTLLRREKPEADEQHPVADTGDKQAVESVERTMERRADFEVGEKTDERHPEPIRQRGHNERPRE